MHNADDAGPRASHFVWRTSAVLLAALVLLALGLRVASLRLVAGTIDWEGGEYARLAQNLLLGNGYIGLDLPGKNLMFPPLFPLAIAGASWLTSDLEIAARSISVLAGALLPIPIFFLARRLYGAGVGHLAALLVALHPLLVHFSATACSEPIFLLLLASAVCLSGRALKEGTPGSFALAGGGLGFAYLTRIEAAAFPLIVVVLALLRVRWIRTVGPGRAVAAVMCLPLAFALVVSPYVLWLHGETGQWRLEAKSPLNIETARRVLLEGQDINQAHYAVEPNLAEQGVWLKPAIASVREVRFSITDVIQLIKRRASVAFPFLWDTVTGKAFGTPMLISMAFLGVFASQWKNAVQPVQLLMLAIVLIACLQTTLIIFENVRFLLVPLPFLLIWAAAGALHLMRWLRGTLECSDYNFLHPVGVSRGGVFLILLVSLSVAYRVAHQVYPIKKFDKSTRFVAEIGRQLSSGVETRVHLAEASTAFFYYADAEWVPLPYSTSETALNYFDKRQVTHIALRESAIDSRPYLRNWMANGIPSPRAELIQDASLESGERFRIYRWTAPNKM
jgi:hypothetical protein